MSLIIMCCHDTAENGRAEYTKQTITCLAKTVNWNKHRLIIIDNDSCKETKDLLKFIEYIGNTIIAFGDRINGVRIITNTENVGTAKAINQALLLRKQGESCVKIDNDVVIHQSGWVEQLEAVLERDPSIGIAGLKRKDLAEWPLETGWAKSELIALPHAPGETWVVVEKVNHVMGTCQMLSSNLLDAIGYYYQGEDNVYGFDDSLLSLRSTLAGFKNVFLPHIDIDHIDTGGTEYTDWKHKHASEKMAEYNRITHEYMDGTRAIYYDGGFAV